MAACVLAVRRARAGELVVLAWGSIELSTQHWYKLAVPPKQQMYNSKGSSIKQSTMFLPSMGDL